MLKRIECDVFAEPYKIIDFNEGLNVVLGDAEVGKSYLLWIIQYVLGGNHWPTVFNENSEFISNADLKITFSSDDKAMS